MLLFYDVYGTYKIITRELCIPVWSQREQRKRRKRVQSDRRNVLTRANLLRCLHRFKSI